MESCKRPVICLPAIDWQYLFHRPQQLMFELSRAGHPVYYVNPNQVAGCLPEKAANNLWIYKDDNLIPDYIVNAAIYFIYLPWYSAIIQQGGGKFIVYDCIDDDPAFNGHEEQMLSHSDLVICVSDELIKKHRDKHPHIMLLPNGVDIDHYKPRKEPAPPDLADICDNAEAVIGFTGAFFNGWVDTGLLYYLASEHPKWHLVIIGEAYGWDFTNAPPNLYFLGRKPYEALPSYTRCFDAGLIPFLDNQIARGADPVKLYEYLAAGIPVVTRNLPFARNITHPLVYKYDTRDEFIQAISAALTDDKTAKNENRKKRLAFASHYTWENQASILLARLQQLTWLEALR